MLQPQPAAANCLAGCGTIPIFPEAGLSIGKI